MLSLASSTFAMYPLVDFLCRYFLGVCRYPASWHDVCAHVWEVLNHIYIFSKAQPHSVCPLRSEVLFTISHIFFLFSKFPPHFSFCASFYVFSTDVSLTLTCHCLVAKSCLILSYPMDCSTPGLPVLPHLPKFVQICVHWVEDAI